MRIIKTDITDKDYRIMNLLHYLSSQLSDGYWENEERYYEEFWNWLEFYVQKGRLVIKVKGKPTWKGTRDIFSEMTDDEVVHYVGDVLRETNEDCCGRAYIGFEDIISDAISLLTGYKSDKEAI